MQEERFRMNDKRNTVVDQYICTKGIKIPVVMCTKLRVPPALSFQGISATVTRHSTPFSIFCENSAKILPKISPARSHPQRMRSSLVCG
jgi:hypothetical protein